MFDPKKRDGFDTLLCSLACQAIEFARAGDKAGIIRVRYTVRQIYRTMPIESCWRLTDLSDHADNEVASYVRH